MIGSPDQINIGNYPYSTSFYIINMSIDLDMGRAPGGLMRQQIYDDEGFARGMMAISQSSERNGGTGQSTEFQTNLLG